MDINIVPVTETEMRDFFERLTTTFVSLSQQARQLEEVQKTLGEVQSRLNELQSENERLRKSESDAWEFARDMEHTAEAVKVERDEAKQKAQWQQETIVARDARVTELEAQLKSVTEERDSLRQANERLERAYSDQSSHIDALATDLDQANHNVDQYRKERDEAIASLNKVRSILQPSEPPTPSPVETDTVYPKAVSSW